MPGEGSRRNLTVDAVVVFGILVSIGLIAVSVALNVRMGYRSADSDVDGKLYGLGAGLGDCLKAISPFMASWGIRQGDLLAVASATVLFIICTGYSFMASLGFAAEQRAGRAGVAQGAIDSYGDLRAEKTRLQDRLAFLGPQRSVSAVEADIKAIFSSRAWKDGPTVGVVSADCTLNRKATRTACERVAKLQVERESAAAAEEVASSLEALLARFAGRSNQPVVQTIDAQVDALAKVAGLVAAVGKEQIGLGLSLLLACFIEVGSGLGLYMVTTPWRVRNTSAKLESPAKGVGKRLGHVDAYMLARVLPGNDLLSESALHADYVRWCRMRNEVAYVKDEFVRRFARLAAECGLESTTRGTRVHYRNVRLSHRADDGRGMA